MDSKKDIPVVSIVAAQSGTGKTTLIEKLIKILKERGYCVGILKHDAHKFEIDHKGKDTWRYTQAGADNVVISSPEKLAMVQLVKKELRLEEVLALFKDVDIILIEGYKSNNYPKIEVHRETLGGELLYRNSSFDLTSFIALASDESLEAPIPVFNLNNPLEIVDFIQEKFLEV